MVLSKPSTGGRLGGTGAHGSKHVTELSEMAEAADDVRFRAFIADSLSLWRVDGTVDAAEAPTVAVIRAEDGKTVWIERPSNDTPFRWLVRWCPAGDVSGGAGQQRARPYASLTGLLKALRGALDVDRGNAVRIVPAPAHS